MRKQITVKDAKLKKQQTFKLKLTKLELVHLRDVFSIMLPPDLTSTVSQALAGIENRSLVETHLWNKIVASCKEADIHLDEDAPDFICASSSPPPIGVFKLANEPLQHDKDNVTNDDSTIFDTNTSEE